jgi:membrane-associated protease RseP (regulator of RpoE activity)
MVNPVQGVVAFVSYISLPFSFTTFGSPVTDWFETPFHAPTFWILANVLYWIFWISLMLGLTNALPAVPLDGGALFRDVADSLIRRVRPSLQGASLDRAVRRTSTSVSLLILVLILAQLIVPRLGLAG